MSEARDLADRIEKAKPFVVGGTTVCDLPLVSEKGRSIIIEALRFYADRYEAAMMPTHR